MACRDEPCHAELKEESSRSFAALWIISGGLTLNGLVQGLCVCKPSGEGGKKLAKYVAGAKFQPHEICYPDTDKEECTTILIATNGQAVIDLSTEVSIGPVTRDTLKSDASTDGPTAPDGRVGSDHVSGSKKRLEYPQSRTAVPRKGYACDYQRISVQEVGNRSTRPKWTQWTTFL